MVAILAALAIDQPTDLGMPSRQAYGLKILENLGFLMQKKLK